MKITRILIAVVLAIAPMILNAQDASKVRPYTLKICVVSGQALDDMGGPVSIIYKGEEIKFCCNQCKKKFLQNPDGYLPKIHAAEKQQAK